MSYSPTSTSTSSLSQVEIESRTRQALSQFDHNMAGIFDRASFYANDLYASVESNPTLTRAQTCFKYTLFGTNCIFLIFGIILMSVGSYAMNNRVAVLSGTTLPTGLIVLGVFIMVLSFTGGIAAYKESTMFLAVYFFFLLIFTIILFFVGIAVLVLKDSAEEYMVEGWNAADEDVRASLQVIFTCCGLTQTYNASGIAQPDPTAILPCPVSDECARTGCTTIAPPCKNSIVSSFRSGVTTAGACGISFSILMMAGLVIVIILMQGIKKKKAQAEIVQLRETMPDTLMDEPIL